MQFITGGPEIPDALVQAHEDGYVVFFCGAGISYPAGLPGFKGLLKRIYELTGTTCSGIEKEAFRRRQFDVALNLLENRHQGGRTAIRRALAEALKPKLRRKGATDTHAALLRLARNRQGALRLVTTNFDRVFHAAARRMRQPFQENTAPLLPIPKASHWNSLVFLHGLLPKDANDTDLTRLVVSSGDFGLAYLTERWAARFVSELFRSYIVCFVGYSIDDPVLRYMMDALAADRIRGETTPQAWALGACEPGKKAKTIERWKARGVSPILYPVPAGAKDHSTLHQTLQAWAEIYRDGLTGKGRIVVTHARARPSASTEEDNFVGRMRWALSDPSGQPAHQFASFDPAPGLEWLFHALDVDCHAHTDLARFGVPPHGDVDPELVFSLIRRPASYRLTPRMALVAHEAETTRWDPVMSELGQWLTRHLDDPRLVLWIARNGGRVHSNWRLRIERRLDEISKLEREGKTSELDQMRANAPNAIPGPLMRTLWQLVLGGQLKSPLLGLDLYQWRGRLKRDGWTTALRLELRTLLAPRLRLREPTLREEAPASGTRAAHMKELVEWELVLAADHAREALPASTDPRWQALLPGLVDDFQQLLRDALDLRRDLSAGDEYSDRSYWDLPSIAPHRQNRRPRDWAILIELLRDAWLAIFGTDRARASHIASSWFELPYPTFKRLALFAASQDGCTAPEGWTEWLLADGGWWLWIIDTRREVLRLLVLRGRHLTPTAQERLEAAILAGPPPGVYGDDLGSEEWERFAAGAIWLRLAKLAASGLTLAEAASAWLVEFSRLKPSLQLADDERDEFPYWTTGTGDPDYEEFWPVEAAPRKRRELVRWLARPVPEERGLREDDWKDVCRTRIFHSLCALHDLARENKWPAERWATALQVWSDGDLIRRAWHFGAAVVRAMPDPVMQQIARAVAWWLEAAAKSSDEHEAILLDLCRRILNLPRDAEPRTGHAGNEGGYELFNAAANHFVGLVTHALLRLWFKRKPLDDEGLPEEFRGLFSRLCDEKIEFLRHGRILLAAQSVAFFRVDRPWAEEHLLPCFDWAADPIEARAAWVGFLWSPRLYAPLLLAIKGHLLETARHLDDLGELLALQYAAFLTYAAVEGVDGYAVDEWRTTFEALGTTELQEAAHALVQALTGAGEQRAEYWRNRIRPFWHDIWPKSRGLATPQMAEHLAMLCVAAGEEFPSALDQVAEWLQPVADPYSVIDRLCESDLCGRFPEASLQFLARIVGDHPHGPSELAECLNSIVQADARLAQDPRYRRLQERAQLWDA